MCSVARGSDGPARRHPSAATSVVELPLCLFSDAADGVGSAEGPGSTPSRRARFILSSTSVIFPNVGDVILAVEMAEETEEHVEDDDGPGVADVREVVDRRPADIHPHVGRIDRDEYPLFACPSPRIIPRRANFSPVNRRLLRAP